MKKLLLVSTISALTLTSVFAAPQVRADDVAQNLCQYVAADDKKRLRSFLKMNKLKIRSVFKGVQCNGQNLLEFAAARGSVKTGSLMISKLPKKTVSANLAVIQSGTPLFDAANARVSS
ncbi:DUF3718 domain-containing protein [Endozoicomonas sp. G2_1]|uniref:DUF3718 domain-containing protein n=1 Tax=Endozoicomonas sp. G2_1 TaxID=2821091 RepID=UPI001ADA07C6|nr:DUF3718 domain-containing protein [Endozoicomonas sp. G2_1]MBO9492170.1 DUF3718 domain-containing protein [Endozoicomonas sp. G2_1]